MACGMVPVTGTVVEVGPVKLAPYDTTYQYVAIRDETGALRKFTTVRAVPELSGLVERDAIGIFLFWDGPTECRLCFVYRADGPRDVDFEAVREYLEQA
jgi:hypothetical protein